jgi:hypothetical protein
VYAFCIVLLVREKTDKEEKETERVCERRRQETGEK